ncbi:transglycosylase domain-containing protein [Falsirhodobacter sp. 20TX0035]|uniref:transglycosylase domain-containing protein n=1 Tax=Falsirhodobacter sp. 20TX0035 TaxID=3022019 RepID=UPI00232DD419|nr:PBP1A family penicillin-binding protein [Falsirhodobacter sp. 20TX0035]MDB6454003.1 PBP1A family penicillin-binding protein [Falsirhodobacter sp. 20TX0035]
MSGPTRRTPLVAEKRYAANGNGRGTAGGGNGGGGQGGGGGGGGPRKPAPRKPAPKRPPRNPLVALVLGLLTLLRRVVWGVFWRSALVVALVVGAATFYFASTLPQVSDLLDARVRGSVTMLDNNGETFAWRGEVYGGSLRSEDASANLRNAVVATEDRRFYRHFGVSPRGIASAVAINLRAGRGPFDGNGGSTITQQVAKLLCLGVQYDPEKWKSEAEYEADCRTTTLWRKIKEVPYALAMEAKYSKADILTIYFNRVYLGAGARGFEAAAERYFGKSAKAVEPAEAAMLAGLLRAPSYYAPTNNLQRAIDRANVIVGLMEEQGYLTPEQARYAMANPAQLSGAAEDRSGGFFADWVMESGPDFLTRDTTEDVVIQTTMDQRLQRATQAAVTQVFKDKVSEGSKAQTAVIVMSPDGAVRAMVGGRTVEPAGSFNRATQALRQTGSSFKPFVYAAAMDAGFSPADFVEDKPFTLNIPGSGPWTPSNYDHTFSGVVTLTHALAHSLNIPAVRVSEAVGRQKVIDVASRFGIHSNLVDSPSLALGVSEATLLEMTGAYAGILNGGMAVSPYGLTSLRLRGDDTPLIGQTGGIGERVISDEAAQLLTYMMTQVIETGTGRRAKLPSGREAAGKTGTTQAARDAWFMGFTADYVVGVWMGYDDNTPLKGVTGGGLPADIWREVMSRIEDGQPLVPLRKIVPEPRVPPSAPTNAPVAEVQPVPQAQPQPSGEPNVAERILNDVRRAFGG